MCPRHSPALCSSQAVRAPAGHFRYAPSPPLVYRTRGRRAWGKVFLNLVMPVRIMTDCDPSNPVGSGSRVGVHTVQLSSVNVCDGAVSVVGVVTAGTSSLPLLPLSSWPWGRHPRTTDHGYACDGVGLGVGYGRGQ
jgi:hypothetical protein